MKMKKMIFLMLTLIVLGAASVNAQVRIGGETGPNPAAILDLNAVDASTNGKLGVALPRVTLISLGSPLEEGKKPDKGTMVYNVAGTFAQGAYVWDGVKWSAVKGSSSYIGGFDRPDYDGIGCDGSVIFIGAFDYANGTSGDVAVGITDAATGADHTSLPNFSAALTDNDVVNNGVYLCVYKQDGSSSANWADAVNKCATGEFADGDPAGGWYLPNARELQAIYNALGANGGDHLSFYNLVNNGAMVTYTRAMASTSYWSSTEVTNGGTAWLFGFNGGTYTIPKPGTTYVRCVRRL
ncbi:hypothetical protein FACS189440_16020 [Bacteroidia bacterium]|nr:hypothetical protein FACS189440_16020 [Bacteroidia bacterium]